MTSATSSTIEGIFKQGRRLIHVALQYEPPHHWGGVGSAL
jgi:hypothetical protein